jgi:hypothetical protein
MKQQPQRFCLQDFFSCMQIRNELAVAARDSTILEKKIAEACPYLPKIAVWKNFV